MKKNNDESKTSNESKMMALILSFIQYVVSFPNVEQAKKLLNEQAHLVFNKFYKKVMMFLTHAIKQLEGRVKRSLYGLKTLEKKVDRAQKRVPIGGQLVSGNFISIFRNWSPKNQLNFVLAGSFIFIMLATGTTNVFTNVTASGNPVFIDTPFLALLISMLFPAGTFSAKFLRESMESESLKKYFTQSVHVLALFSILFWGHQFSLNFPGFNAGIDLDSLNESTGTGSWMVKAQLLAEFMVCVSVFFAMTDYFNLYIPDTKDKSPELIYWEKALATHSQAHEKLVQELNEKRGQLSQLEDDRNAFANQVIAKFLSLRIKQKNSSFDDSFNDL